MATLQLSVQVRNARLDALESSIGTTPILELRSGALPANCAAAASGTLLAQFALPSDYLSAAAAGSKALSGTWSGVGLAANTIGYFRIYEAGSPSQAHIQGDVTATGGGGAMTVDNTNIAVGQVVNVTSFTLTDGNA
jgi:hypothetical protein